jgi:hypothetical protein
VTCPACLKIEDTQRQLILAREERDQVGAENAGLRLEVQRLTEQLAMKRDENREAWGRVRSAERSSPQANSSSDAWAYQLLDAQPTWPHPSLGGLVKVVAHYEHGRQSIDGRVVATAIAKAKQLPPPTKDYGFAPDYPEDSRNSSSDKLRLIRDFITTVVPE